MGIRHEQVVDEILILDFRRRTPTPAALLSLVDVDRLGLGIAAMGKRHHDFLLRDQVFDAKIGVILHDFGPTLVAKCVPHIGQLATDHIKQQIGIGQDIR